MKGLAAGILVGAAAVMVAVVNRTARDNASRTAMEQALAAPPTVPATLAAAGSAGTIDVYKSATCGCCHLWVEYMRGEGFTVVEHDVENIDAVPAKAGVPKELESCHTAHIGGYVIEGHVPAEDIKKMLAERPKIAGLAVPGMVAGSPGMPGANPQHYDVVAYDKAGTISVYAKH
jgi:hypothetical protein